MSSEFDAVCAYLKSIERKAKSTRDIVEEEMDKITQIEPRETDVKNAYLRERIDESAKAIEILAKCIDELATAR